MADIMEPSAEQIAIWDKWVEERPPVVRDICRKIKPWKLYKLKDTGQRCTFYSCNEDGTVTVDISGDFNFLTFSRRVFGVDPNNLEECALPTDDELLGEFLTPAEQLNFINSRRAENGLEPFTEEEFNKREED